MFAKLKSASLPSFIIVATLAVVFGLLAFASSTVDKRASRKSSLAISEAEKLTGDPARGAILAAVGGCVACHTNVNEKGIDLAGGRPLSTAFGTFYTPNITSHKGEGIGAWSMPEFIRAMTVGVRPDNEHYYPAFPYTAFSVINTQDLVDLKAWLDTVKPVSQASIAHDLYWPISMRSFIFIWKALFFDPLRSINEESEGGYLVNGLAHCAECHSPRNLLGGLATRNLSGNTRGPDNASVPGITANDLQAWTLEDLDLYLEVGITPTGDFVGGHMSDVIEYGTSELSKSERISIARYLLSHENR